MTVTPVDYSAHHSLTAYKPKLARLRNYLSLNLHYLRKEVNNLSYKRLMNKTGIAVNVLYTAERRGSLPDYITICKLAEFYKVDIVHLIGIDIKAEVEKAAIKQAKKAESDQKILAKINKFK